MLSLAILLFTAGIGIILSFLCVIPHIYTLLVNGSTYRMINNNLKYRNELLKKEIEENFKEREEWMKIHGKDVIKETIKDGIKTTYYLDGTKSRIYWDAEWEVENYRRY